VRGFQKSTGGVAYLNDQDGFDDHKYIWRCTECDNKNSISSDNIYKSHEDYWNSKD